MNMHLADGPAKASFVADVINKSIYTLITNCTKADGVRDYFYLALVGYSGQNARSLFMGERAWTPVSKVANTPLRIEERTRKIRSDSGDIINQSTKLPVWLDPTSAGKTSMCAGLTHALRLLGDWCENHPNGFPPTVLHVTDGHPTDGDPEPIAIAIHSLQTTDGNTLVYNLHVDIGQRAPILFPSSEAGVGDKYAKKLFRMSSVLPTSIASRAASLGYSLTKDARGFVFNAGLHAIVDFFDLGTRANVAPDR